MLPSQAHREPIIESEPLIDTIQQHFAPAAAPSDEQLAIAARVDEMIRSFFAAHYAHSDISFEQLNRLFSDSRIPDAPRDVSEYLDYFAGHIVAHSTHTSSPSFIGHMTSALPDFMQQLARLVTALNQNVVKVETAKAVTPYERQTIGMLHRLIYDRPDSFYAEHLQQSESTLGTITSGGTVGNITALWIARNTLLGPRPGFAGVEQEGLYAALRHYGYDGAVVIGSSLMHYSFKKAADLLGIGLRGLVTVPVDQQHRIDLAALRRTIAACRARNQLIIALVGVGGTTDVGSIDPLDQLADIAQEHGLLFHVDAAWGGPLLFSRRHRHKLAGIERADSVIIDGHKQLYLPMGIGMVLLRGPHQAQAIEKQAPYIVRARSADLGRRTLEGSRPAMSIFLHAALSILGRDGYEALVDEGVRKTGYMARALAARPEFELLMEPQSNILLYRYLPARWRTQIAAQQLDQAGQQAINRFNERLQQTQLQDGESFISRTTIETTRYGRAVPIVALRAVISNPLTMEQHIDAVLDRQALLGAQLSD